jgi:hypothetical protein
MTRCRCGLDTEPPIVGTWWRPDLDDDPGRSVNAVIRVGDDPTMRHALRVPGGWAERGLLVDYYIDITPPMHWSRVGRCWAGTPHPVVSVTS